MNHTNHSKSIPQRARHHICRWCLLPLLLLLALPAAVQAQFLYTTNNGTITITGYTGPGGAVTIPSTLNGLPVTAIGICAFFGCTNLTNITIPGSVTSIGASAFGNCTSLTSVTIPDSVTNLGGTAFFYCISLTNVTLGDGITRIGDGSFMQCGLTSLRIPDSVTSIGDQAFVECTRLTNFTLGNRVARIGNYAFNDCQSLTSVTVPDSVTSIGNWAFGSCLRLTTVMIGNGVINVGDFAFNYCPNLTSVSIGNGVSSIGIRAFSSCPSLTSVTIPDSVIGIEYGAFGLCTGLTNATIGSGLTSIGEYAFDSCTNLIALHFAGNAPSLGGPVVFQGDNHATVYYLPGTTGWGPTFGGLPTARWPEGAPEALTLSASSITTNSATLNGTVNPDRYPTTAWFEWGTTTGYGNLTSVTNLGSGTNALPLSAPLAGLTLGVTYHFRVAATNDHGLAYGSDQSFTTAALPLPEASTLPATGVSTNSATLNGTVNPKGYLTSAWFQWGTTTSYGNLTPAAALGSGTAALPFSASLSGLTAGVTYHFLVAATNDNGLAYGSDQSLTTATSPTEFDYTITNGTITITGYVGPGGDVTIPGTIDGLPVTSIGEYAFFLCSSLTKVTIPNSVTTIGRQAFMFCGSLTSASLGNGVTSIGYEPFGDCTNLTSLTVDPLNSAYSSVDSVLFNKTQTTLVQYLPGLTAASYTIPNGVTRVEDRAFAFCQSLTNITIPSSVTFIGKGAFWACASLRTITIPDRVTMIGDQTFEDCTSLVKVEVGNSVTTIGDSAFCYCPILSGVYFNGNAPSLGGSQVFLSTTNATIYYLPGTTGWGMTFGGLPTALWQTPPEAWTLSVTSNTANSATLNGVVNPNGWLTTAWFQWGANTNYGNLTPMSELGSGATALPLAAPLAGLTLGVTYHFRVAARNDYGLVYGSDQSFTTSPLPLVSTLPATGVSTNSATLNGTVNPIGWPTTAWFQWGSTANYGNLTSVADLGSGTNALPFSAPLAGLIPGVTYHFRVAATNDNGLAYGSDQSFTTARSPTEFNYTITNGTITITGYTGPGGGVTIPGTINGLPVTSIGDYAFWGQALTSVTIPNSVTSIGAWAFGLCLSLTNVTIPNSVTSIGHMAFVFCGRLTSVSLGSAVTSIGSEPFEDCTNLTSITVDALNPAYCSVEGVLFNKMQTTLVQYPLGLAAASYTIPNGVTSVEDGAFAFSQRLSNITLPSSVTSIGKRAFWDCGSLRSITILDGVASIGDSAFAGCTSLTNVTIPNRVTSIGDYAFDYCTSLTSVTFSSGVTSIGDWAFMDCTSLTALHFGGNAPSLGGPDVFQRDTKATVYYLPGTAGWGTTFGGLPTALWQPSGAGAWTLSATDVTTNSAMLNGTVNPNGFLTVAWFQWGTTTNYGTLTAAIGMGSGTNSLPLSAPLAGLTPGVTYHFRVAATNDNGLLYGSDQSFTTGWTLNGGATMTGNTITLTVGTGNTSRSAFLSNKQDVTAFHIMFFYQDVSGAGSADGVTFCIQNDPRGATALGGGNGGSSLGYQNITPSVALAMNIYAPNGRGIALFQNGAVTYGYASLLPDVDIGGNSDLIQVNVDYNGTVMTVTFKDTVTEGIASINWTVNIPSVVGGSTAYVGFTGADGGVASIQTISWGNSSPAMLILALPATGVSTNSAILNSTVNPNGSPTTAWFEWGTTTGYGNLTSATALGSGTTALPLSAPLAGLTLGVTYHFRVAATNDYGLAYGSDQSFTTLGPPQVSTLPATGVSPSSATLDGTVNPNGWPTTAWFQWGATSSYGNLTSATALGSGTTALPLSASLAGLALGVTYHFRVAATNEYGLAYGSDQTFTTATSPTEFNYTINNGTITITGYTGPGGAVTIPDTINGLPVTSIGYAAFYDCTNLTSMRIGSSVTSIDDYAFGGCSGLINATIGTNVASIGVGAFLYCLSLTNIAIPDSVTNIGSTSFYQCAGLTSVTIGNKLMSIAAQVFQGCTSLTNITIPDSVTSIGTYGFFECESLTRITIPNSVTSIGDQAFSDCVSLTNVAIPKSVTSIGIAPFAGCANLSAVSVDTLNPIYSSVDGVLFDKNQTTLIEYPYGKAGSYTIPSSVTIIGDWAFFQCGRLITVTIPSSVVSIGDDAFSSCYSLTSLAIPHSVTHLGASAFEDCLSLTSVTLPNSVTNIADGMFENCRSLTSVTIPNGVTSIGKQAFASCGLGSVTIPSSVFSLGPWAFAGCWKLRSVYCEGNAPSLGNQYVFGNDSSATVYYSPGTFGWGATYGGLPTALGPPPPPYIFATNNSAITITGYFGEGGAVTIPTRINGLLVTSIGDWAFENCSSVTSVTILNGVTNIGAWAFHNCTRLTGITIPSSVASIANWAFCSCTNLTSITIPNGVTSLGNWAFIDCTSLTNVMIGSGVTSIGDWAFSGCASLTSICFAGNAPSLGGSSVFSGDNDATVYYLPGTTGWGLTFGGLPTALWQSPPPMAWTLSASTITASGAMLNGTVNPSGSFTAARFEWGTTTGYGNLTSLANLGSGTNALPLSAPLAGLTPGVTYHFRVAATNVYGLAYGSDQSFTTLGPPQVSRLPATAVTTNSAALNGTVNPNGYPTTAWFQWGTTTGYGNLTAATDMGSGISNLPLSVALTGLTPGVTYHFRITVTNDYGLAYASDQSFTTATLPTEFNYWINNGAVTITRYNGPGGDVIIPYAINGLPVTGIGDYAFAGCNSLTSVTIPNSVTSIGHDAFGACTSLTSISVGTLNSAYSSVEGVLFNKTQTTLVQYPAGIAATSYSIPNSVTSMGDYAFDSCTSLTSITIPNSVTSIGNYVCGGCTSLSSVTIPAGVTIIGEWAFSGCSSLTNLTIPNSVTSIGQEAFDWCTNLTSITIPNSVTSIGDYAFYGCTSLRSVTIGSGVTSIGTNAFFYCFSLTAITVDAANSFYSSVDGVWLNKSQTTLIECPGGKTGAYTIPNGVTGIGRFAFAYCTSLLSVTIPSSVTNIGSEAFWSCINLTSVTIPDSVSSIADYAFQWCTNLTSVTIGSGVTDIGFAAFYNCTSLTSVTIGSGVTDIGSAAFYACTNLTRLYFGGNAPSLGGSVFPGDNHATVYYLPGTTGWGSTFGGRPTALWTQVPTIQASPQSQTAEAASAVGLRVKASSPLPLFYFWHLNATNLLSSGTNWQLELTNLELSQSGAYTVVISNVLGAITSAPALLNVIAPVERRPVPGIKVTGETGSLLNLDYTDSLSPAPRWTPLGSVSLASASQSYFDLTLPLPLQRFYRAWQTGTPGVLPYLNLQLVPAITLTGSIGHSVRVDAINQFGPVDAWFTLDTVTLTNTSQLYFDTSAWQQPPRLYRLMQVP